MDNWLDLPFAALEATESTNALPESRSYTRVLLLGTVSSDSWARLRERLQDSGIAATNSRFHMFSRLFERTTASTLWDSAQTCFGEVSHVKGKDISG